MLELDRVIRENQLARLPISKSGAAEAKLLEDHPELIEILERNKRAKVDFMALRSHFNEDDETKGLGTSKSKADLSGNGTPSPRLKASSGTAQNRSSDSTSPALRAQRSMNDLMFPMHDLPEASLPEVSSDLVRPSSSGGRKSFDPESSQPNTPQPSLPRDEVWRVVKGKAIVLTPMDVLPGSAFGSPSSQPLDAPLRKQSFGDNSPKDSAPGGLGVWGAASFTPQKLDMKDIFEQTSATRAPILKSALSQQLGSASKPVAGPSTRLSQKERKKQLQQQQQLSNLQPEPATSNETVDSSPTPTSSSSAWQTAHTKPRVSLQDIFAGDSSSTPSGPAVSPQRRPPPHVPLTMRQTVPGNAASQTKAPTPNPPLRSLSSGPQNTTPARQSRPSLPFASQSTPDSKLIPRSIRHTSLPVEPSLNLSMADILSQQQTEKDIIHEAATAKRSLQEIQEEQAFQEWWDQESRKVQEEEERGKGVEKRGREKSRGRGRGRVQGERGGLRGRAVAQEGAVLLTGGGERADSRDAKNEGERGRGRRRAVHKSGAGSSRGEERRGDLAK